MRTIQGVLVGSCVLAWTMGSASAAPSCPKGSTAKGGPKSPEAASWCEDAEGNAQGHYVKWRANGNKLLEGEMKDGDREGLWIYWGDNGAVSVDSYVGGQKVGYFVEFYSGSCVPKLEGENPAGISIWYVENGDPQEAEHVNADGKRRPASADEVKAAFTKYTPTREKVCKIARSSGDAPTQSIDKVAAYEQAKKPIASGTKGASIAKKAEVVVRDVCRYVTARTVLTQKIDRECPLKTEQVGEVEIGTSARACSQKRLADLGREDVALQKKLVAAKNRLKPIADDAAKLGEQYQRDYAAFLQTALDCFCPDPASGEAASCK